MPKQCRTPKKRCKKALPKKDHPRQPEIDNKSMEGEKEPGEGHLVAR